MVIDWEDLGSLSDYSTRDELKARCEEVYTDKNAHQIANNAGQIWAFANLIHKGDLVLLPFKGQAATAIGHITGDYQFQPNLYPACHTRPVKWLTRYLQYANLDADICTSLGSKLTVFQIKRERAEERILAACGANQ